MDRIKIGALGGLDENGRDCYIIEINDDMFVVEAGVLIPDKTMPGIDLILPNAEYIFENKHRLKAYIITHGHDENMSALKFIITHAPAPIYCTYSTKNALIGQATIHHKEYPKTTRFEIVNPNDSLVIAGHEIELFQTYHNAANSFGICFKTDRGNIIYSSDFIVDFTSEYDQYKFGFEKLYKLAQSRTLLLMSESKCAHKEGYCSPKHRIINKIEKYFKENKRLFISCFWQNAYRIAEICKLVNVYHKKIYFYDDYTRTILTDMMNSDVGISFKPEDIVSKENFNRVRAQDLVVLIVGQSAHLYREICYIAQGVNADNRISLTSEDIFINCAVPSPIQEVEATKCLDTLYRTDCQTVWFNAKNASSMHAYQDDLKALLNILKPLYYFPVRGTFSRMMSNAKLALDMNIGLNHMNVFVLDNGMQISFEGDSPRPKIIPNEVNHIDVSPAIVNGTGISLCTDKIVEERVQLANDGVVVIAATVSKSKKAIVAGPDCQMRGFVFLKEAEPLLKSISQIFVDEINTAISIGDFTFNNAKANIIDRAQKFIKRENGREPLISPIIVTIE